jgi:hypothetical protein
MLFLALSSMALTAMAPVEQRGLSIHSGHPLSVTRASTSASPVYVDAIDYPTNGGGWDAFYGLERRLARDFNDVCGDTFCEGEYSNIQHLRYRCSVRAADGVMGECIWTFAGSNQEVDKTSGKVVVDGRIWECRSPIMPGTTLGEFYRALAGGDAIHARLPHGSASIYDGLVDCGF